MHDYVKEAYFIGCGMDQAKQASMIIFLQYYTHVDTYFHWDYDNQPDRHSQNFQSC